MHEDVAIIVVGCVAVLLGFFYTGIHNRAFGRGKPEYPPTLQMRIVFICLGVLFVVFGVVKM